ncbi:MAG: prolyl oligopeptidase family serine peptidase [Pirellulales bacterium]
MTFLLSLLALLMVGMFAPSATAQDAPYIQTENVVYGEVHGVGLLMDVFVPTGEKNGLGVVDVISGAWHSDRGKIRDHARAQTFDILCGKGYTVFAVRPGSVTKFSAGEMLANLNLGIRWAKDHSSDYGIDPDRLGLMGASAGGHLACLAAVTAEAEGTADTRVKAVAVFFPPTDFLDFNGKAIDSRGDDRMGPLVRRLAFVDGLTDQTDAEVEQAITQISPARLVTLDAPPFLLIHGDADTVVPLQQSELMANALNKAGVPAELIVKEGGGHPWLTMHEEVQVLADWFDKQLGAE